METSPQQSNEYSYQATEPASRSASSSHPPPWGYIPFYKNKKIFTIMVMVGIGLIILGGTMCAVSAITFRPDPESEGYEKAVQDKGELTGFTYMIGAAFLQLGMLTVIFVIGLIVVNELFPTKLRVTAGIMVILLCNLFFWVFVLSGPVRVLNIIGGW